MIVWHMHFDYYEYMWKRAQLRGSCAFYGLTSTKLFEEDHLIPLEVGEAPLSAANILI